MQRNPGEYRTPRQDPQPDIRPLRQRNHPRQLRRHRHLIRPGPQRALGHHEHQ